MDSKQACCHMGIDSLIRQEQRESSLSFQQVLDQASASQTLCFSSADEVAFPITVCGTESGSVRCSAKQIPDCWVQKCSWCWCLVCVPQDMRQAGWGHGMSWDTCGRERKSNTSASVHLITSAASPRCSPAPLLSLFPVSSTTCSRSSHLSDGAAQLCSASEKP